MNLESYMKKAKFIIIDREIYKKMIPVNKKEWKKEMKRNKI